MANWAIVIGIDKYWTPSACLSGAVRDALRMREWLLDTNGGSVLPHNLFSLLSPNKPEEVPHGLKYLPGTQEMIIKVIERVVHQSGGEGDRLFFHYSGHGLSACINFSEEEALVPEDFTDQLTIRSLGLRSILEYFETTRFREQFFFIDACRDIPWEGGFRIGEMSWPRRRDRSRPAVQQFVFHATSPGIKAAESGPACNEQGAFTQTLLGGLRGKGKAKVWDYMSDQYLVRVERLLDYLVVEMEKKKIAVGGAGDGQMFQVPRRGGECGAVGGSNPILARFPADAFDDESLEILLDPFVAEQQAAVGVEREGTTVAHQTGIAQVPIKFTLPPREYIVQASALAFEPKDRCVVELYEAEQITIKLVPKPGQPTEAEQAILNMTTQPERGAQNTRAGLKFLDVTEVLKDTVLHKQPEGWSEGLRSTVRDGMDFLQKYGEFMNRTDRAKLLDLIGRGQMALGSADAKAGILAEKELQNQFHNSGTASTLLIAEWLMEVASAEMKKWVAQDAHEVRAAYAVGDTEGVERYSGEIWQITKVLVWCLLRVTQFMWSLCSRLMPSSAFSWKELAKSAVIVMSDDPLALLEITSSAGEILQIGSGVMPCPDLGAGFYRARLLSPEGQVTERLIEFSGGAEVVSLSAPKLPQTRVMQEMIRRGKFSVRRDNTLRIEKTMKPIATAQVSTILLLAGSAAMHDEHSAKTRRLRNLGVTPFSNTPQPDAESGVQALFGIEHDVRGRADEYSLRLWSQDEAVPESLDHPSKFSQVEGLAEFARATRPGNYWLAVQSREQKPIVFSLKTLPRRLTMVIVHVNSKNEARFFQYLLPFSTAKGFEPEMLRRLELIQRFYLSGRPDHAYKFAKDLLNSSESDPLAVCLGGYLLLRISRVEEAGQIAHQMIESFNEMSDGFVLNAEYEASRGRSEAAAEASLAALERGMPVFSDGLVRLFDSVRRYRIKHSRTDLLTSMFKSRARGIIWSAWSPKSIAPGSLLSPAIASGAEI